MNNLSTSPADFNVPLSLHQLHGASPTTFFCGKTLFQMMQSKKGLEAFSNTVSSQVSEKMETEQETSYSELHIACCNGDVENVQAILDNTFDHSEINQRDHQGNSPLMWAASEGHDKVVQLLIDFGAFVNLQNYQGETALCKAAERGHVVVCQTLLEHGAEASLGTMEQITPLHFAAASGHINVIETLLRYGAFINAQDEEGDTALHYAVRETQEMVVQYLTTFGKASASIENNDQETPLQLASCLGETRMVEFLSYVDKDSEHEGTFMMSF